ncbi:MAG: hypothetical protein AYK23_01100 [Candidatus Proteinoplasmatales archaeon SG8-5]|nr:MAG: hypothetical protein AYK23_01100 [Candidatus Proteinoplasmatales archaeon SG8-5]
MRLKLEFTKPFSDAVGRKVVEMEFGGNTCGELLERLSGEYPALSTKFYDEDGSVTDYLIIFLNDKPISALEGLDSEVRDGDRLLFFFPISGG